jgi:hypothetical protein
VRLKQARTRESAEAESERKRKKCKIDFVKKKIQKIIMVGSATSEVGGRWVDVRKPDSTPQI